MADLFAAVKVAFDSVWSKGELPPTDVIKHLIAQLLGYAILAGACITKLPQIFNILNAASAEGLSAVMFEIETYCLLVAAIYGYTSQLPFNAYGESLILAVQNVAVLLLLYKYSRSSMLRQLAVFGLYGALVGVVANGQLPKGIVDRLFDANNVLVMASRLPQIYMNFRAKSTGQLSVITCAINVVGCVVRIFTSLQANAGAAMLRSYALSLVLNATMVIQIIMYSRKKPALAASKAESKKSR